MNVLLEISENENLILCCPVPAEISPLSLYFKGMIITEFDYR